MSALYRVSRVARLGSRVATPLAAGALLSLGGQRSLKSAADLANETSYVKGLFYGEVSDRAFPFPDTLSEENKEILKSMVEPVQKYFTEAIDSKKIDETKQIPKETLDGLREMGLFGLQIPEEYNGLGLSNTGYARIVEEISMDASLAVTLMAHQSIGLKGILLDGNEEQKKKYLPKLATGEHIAAFALTEPSSGSDAASIRTKAELSPDGKHWVLNGSKIWISNGGWAKIFTVFARTVVDGKDTMTAFIVDRDFGGITSGPPEDKLGIRGSNTCEVHFENCKVPVENVLRKPGDGFKVAMNILNNGRFGLGAGSGGALKKLIAMTAEHATTRKQFGMTLDNFELIKEKFANIAVDAYAIESMAYMTTNMIDRGDPSCEVEAAICKVFGSEAAFRGINECIQVMGGMGFMKDYPYERHMRDTRILSIFEGTNEILRMLIALTGMREVGGRLQELGKLAKDPLKNYTTLFGEATHRLSGRFAPDPVPGVHADLEDEGMKLRELTTKFGGAVENLLAKHGKDIMVKQTQSKRIADATIDLYAITAVLSRASTALENGLPTAEHEKMLAQTFCMSAAQRINQNLGDIRRMSRYDANINTIADEIFAQGKYLPAHPTGVN
eukprot:Clim_evm5s70 gene=Clim_evmTU5s70